MLEETRKSFENLLKSWKADQSKMTRIRSGRDIKNKRALIKIVSNLSKAIDGVHDLLEHTNKTELKNETETVFINSRLHDSVHFASPNIGTCRAKSKFTE